ncbi:MAG TPA: ATP-binding protein [Gemmatimonadaceae bacterium]|nr:ATP-binding protein [Gemmatimonadaceae bacterium]
MASTAEPDRSQTLHTRVGRRVVLLFLICAMLPVAVLGTVSYITLAESLREQAFDRARLKAKRAGAALAERFGNLESSLISVAAVLAKAPALMGEARVMDDRFVAFSVFKDGTNRPQFGVMPAIPPLTALQQRHLESGGTVLTLSTDPTRSMLMTRRIVTTEPRDVIWAQISDSVLTRVFAAEGATGIEASYCVVMPDGSVVRCVTPQALQSGALAPAILGSSPSGAFAWVAGERYLAGFWALFLDAQYASPDWRIIISQPEAEILAPLVRFRRTFALTTLLAVLVVAFLSTRQIRRSLRPLNALRDGTERIARLEFDRPVEVNSGDEFEDLAGAFNSMSERVQAQFLEAGRLNDAIVSKSEELHEREVRMVAILHASADAIVTIDESGRIESFNRTAERIFGLSEADAIGTSLGDLFGVPLGAGPGAANGSSHSASPILEVAARRSDGTTFPTELKFTEARAGDRTLHTVFIRDISERKRGAEERERLEAQLRHAQKMDTIGTLAGGIAHDFNNILSPIIMNVEMALDVPLSTELKDDLNQVLTAAFRARDLVKQILLFSRRADTAFSTIEVAPIVGEALKLLRSSLPSTIEIKSSVAPDVANVVGDPTQLHQVLMNLCTNAYHAMRERGGTLDVRVDMVDMDAVVGGGAAEQRAVRIVVRDTGEGMNAATLERLFEPFFTTKAVGEGTGLGMSIVHGIITQHGGTIAVESTPGSGSTFEIHLPAAEQAIEAGEQVVPAVSARGEGRILIVDDDAVIAQVVARVLSRSGYDVAQATAASQVMTMLAEAEPPFDLVITDQTMPGMTGIELADRIQTWRRGFPVILLTGYSAFGGHQDPRQHGLREVLMKPVPIAVLAATVARVLAEDRPALPPVGAAPLAA